MTATQIWQQAERIPLRSSTGETVRDKLIRAYGGDPSQRELPEELQRVLAGEIADKAAKFVPATVVRTLGAVPVADLPPGIKPLFTWQGRDTTLASDVLRPMTRQERIEATFDLYRRFAMARESVGGRMDPLFFLNDLESLARTKSRDIRILKFAPRPGTKGYRVSSLGEWRVHTGRAVRLVGVVESGV